MNAESTASEDVMLEIDLPHPPEKVWRAISEGDLAGQWLEAAGLRAELGSRFRLPPADGKPDSPMVDCEVVETVPNERLQWRQSERESTTATHTVESIVTLQLLPMSFGTRLRIVHDDFRYVRTNVISLATTRSRRGSRKARTTCAIQTLRLAA